MYIVVHITVVHSAKILPIVLSDEINASLIHYTIYIYSHNISFLDNL